MIDAGIAIAPQLGASYLCANVGRLASLMPKKVPILGYLPGYDNLVLAIRTFHKNGDSSRTHYWTANSGTPHDRGQPSLSLEPFSSNSDVRHTIPKPGRFGFPNRTLHPTGMRGIRSQNPVGSVSQPNPSSNWGCEEKPLHIFPNVAATVSAFFFIFK